MAGLDTSLIDLIDQSVFVLEPDAAGAPRYSAINPTGCAYLGRPKEEIIGRTALDLTPGPVGQFAYEHHCQAVRTGQPLAYEYYLPVQGIERLLRTSLKPLCDPQGHVRAVIGSPTDVTPRGMDDGEKGGAACQVSETEEFIALAAHDLRAPLRNVATVAEILREDFQDLGDGKLEMIDMLGTVADRAMVMIGDVLSYAQAVSAESESVRFGFGSMVRDIATVLDPMRTCKIHCPDVSLTGDRLAFQIVLRNLIDNALKYWNAGGTAPSPGPEQLVLDIEISGRQNGFLDVTVADNGLGISEPAKLFLAGGSLRVDSGFGMMGLRRLIRARGGTVTVSNRAGRPGAIVTFSLPGRFEGGDAGGAVIRRVSHTPTTPLHS